MAMKSKGKRSGGAKVRTRSKGGAMGGVKRRSKGGAMGGVKRRSKGGAMGGKKIIKRTGGGSVKAASRTSPSTAKANKMGAQMMQRAKTLEDKDFQKAYNYIMKMVEKKKK
jgi:hypothetical protein|tara:strand:+ start:266 stop:598 length:333 start_codon:yes stop_codon:yes gene_type:complete